MYNIKTDFVELKKYLRFVNFKHYVVLSRKIENLNLLCHFKLLRNKPSYNSLQKLFLCICYNLHCRKTVILQEKSIIFQLVRKV